MVPAHMPEAAVIMPAEHAVEGEARERPGHASAAEAGGVSAVVAVLHFRDNSRDRVDAAPIVPRAWEIQIASSTEATGSTAMRSAACDKPHEAKTATPLR